MKRTKIVCDSHGAHDARDDVFGNDICEIPSSYYNKFCGGEHIHWEPGVQWRWRREYKVDYSNDNQLRLPITDDKNKIGDYCKQIIIVLFDHKYIWYFIDQNI